MIYKNTDLRAISAMEEARTGHYGNDQAWYPEQRCPICGTVEPNFFYKDESYICIGCSECIKQVDEL